MAELTPMMQQYFKIKEQCPDYILMYRLGDFYEMFYEDAKTASSVLELTLTGRDCGQEERAPMCGVPFHSCEGYIAKLVRNGYKVAICEQVGDPKASKGIVKREIIRMITPGTVTETSMLDENQNNYICCIQWEGQRCGICFADISTGQMYATGFSGEQIQQELLNEVGRFVPSETVLSDQAFDCVPLRDFLVQRLSSMLEQAKLELSYEEALQRIGKQFEIKDFEAAGLTENPDIAIAVGKLLFYLEDKQMCCLDGLTQFHVYQQGQFMELDFTARRNLELCESMRAKEKRGTLLWVLDKTKTAMGARMLRQWLEKPLINPVQIHKRLDAVAEMKQDLMLRDQLREILSKIFDMERLIGRIVYGTANCRDLRSLQSAISHLPEVQEAVAGCRSALLCEVRDQMDMLEDLSGLIEAAIQPEPPFSVREGGMIREGYSQEVDELRDAANGGKGKLAEIENREREAFGIKNIKVGYNRVFGYYIEVPKSYTGEIPEGYIRKQTLANCERYITEEMKQYENTVLGAQEKLTALEYELFCEVRTKVAAQVRRVQKSALAISHFDVLCSLAEVAEQNQYVMPEVDFSGKIIIRDGRHPVVEQVLRDQMFTPNDVFLDRKENRVAVITGPNMAGKSTYMRQVALIAIMAQMGSFVPARSAQIGIVDKVFTRVGASDDLASGQSTFMVEMNEVAEILTRATRDSLIVLDEIGRGTSTYDGMAIARAVVEYVADPKKIGARTLFATHYHELTALEDLLDGVKNYNIAAKKRGDDVIFLRKIVAGGADDSYGIEVAKLAGVPEPVIRRAKKILADLEKGKPEAAKPVEKPAQPQEEQVSLLDLGAQAVADKLRNLNVNTLTPIEALNAIYEMQKML